jgi:hypothetical protein
VHRIAVHQRPHAAAFEYEPQRGGGVPVPGRELPAAQELHRAPQGVRGEREPAQVRVGEREHPAVAAPVDADQVAGSFREVPQRLPPPDVRREPVG